jgi:hypothetical protein
MIIAGSRPQECFENDQRVQSLVAKSIMASSSLHDPKSTAASAQSTLANG